ncbi:MAG: hypothetical protein ACREQ5_35875, partial [Candidatus Dormibacteria bacterium]
ARQPAPAGAAGAAVRRPPPRALVARVRDTGGGDRPVTPHRLPEYRGGYVGADGAYWARSGSQGWRA